MAKSIGMHVLLKSGLQILPHCMCDFDTHLSVSRVQIVDVEIFFAGEVVPL